MKTSLTAALFATALVATSYSQIYVYESFNMTTGNLDGQTSVDSSGLSGGWSLASGSDANNQIVSGSLSFGSLATSGNSLDVTASNGSEDGEVIIDSTISNAGKLADGQTLWFSLLIDGGVTSNAHSGFAIGTDGVQGAFNGVSMKNTGDGIGFYYQGGTFRAAYWDGGSVTDNSDAESSNDSFTDSDPTLIVGELIWTASGETINLYTPSSSDLSDKGSIVSSITTAADLTNGMFDTISYSVRGSGGGDSYDEIRFGASYEDVTPVPEPGTFALIGGFLALTSVMLRRRRS